MRRWLAVLAVASLLSHAAHGTPAVAPATTRTFDGWTATCNNLKACVVIATAQDDLFYVRIARAAGVTAPPDVKIVLAAEEPPKGDASAFRLSAGTGDKRESLGPFSTQVGKDDPGVLSATVTPGDASLTFIETVRDAGLLAFAVGRTHGTLDLKGLAAALRFVDAAQGRQGTPTALVARGMTPVAQVPAPVAPPFVAAAPAGSVTVVEKPVLSKATADLATGVCDPDVVKDPSGVVAWRVAGDRTIVAVPCTQGAYNLASALYMTGLDGTAPKAIDLPRAAPPSDSDEQAGNVVANAVFDPKTMELTALDKGRGLGDCGNAATWLWNGQAFELLEASGLEACPGALPEDWPSLYSARRK